MNPQGNLFRNSPLKIIVLCQIFLLSSQAVSANEDRIGLVKTFTPSATLIREGKELNVGMGSQIHEGDTIATSSDGTLGIIFSDGSVLTLGPSAKIIIDDFTFNLTENKFSFLSQILEGTVVFLSGAIGKISPGSIHFKTPDTTLGLRGTKIVIEVD